LNVPNLYNALLHFLINVQCIYIISMMIIIIILKSNNIIVVVINDNDNNKFNNNSPARVQGGKAKLNKESQKMVNKLTVSS
jgi:hypothetical protein